MIIKRIYIYKKPISIRRNFIFNMLIPKNLHFIWIGIKIPEKYLNHIVSFICTNTDYKIYLWTDKMTNIYPQIDRRTDLRYFFKVNHNRISISLTQNLIKEIETKFIETKILNKFYFYRECIGIYKNLAAAADILRLYILYLFGGIYLDVDLSLKTPILIDCKFGQVECKHGFLYASNSNISYQCHPEFKGIMLMGNNDMLGCVPFNSIVRVMIENCLDRYIEYDNLTWQTRRQPETEFTKLKNKYILKISKLNNINIEGKIQTEVIQNKIKQFEKIIDELENSKLRIEGRFNQTLYCSGPTLICHYLMAILLPKGELYLQKYSNLVQELKFPSNFINLKCDFNWKIPDHLVSQYL